MKRKFGRQMLSQSNAHAIMARRQKYRSTMSNLDFQTVEAMLKPLLNRPKTPWTSKVSALVKAPFRRK